MYCNRELISDLIFVVVILKESSFQCICFNHWNTKTEMPNCWEVIFLVFMDIKDWPQMQRKLSGKRFRDFRELSTCHVHHRHRSAGFGPQTCQQIFFSKWSNLNSDHIGKLWRKRFRDFRELSASHITDTGPLDLDRLQTCQQMIPRKWAMIILG